MTKQEKINLVINSNLSVYKQEVINVINNDINTDINIDIEILYKSNILYSLHHHTNVIVLGITYKNLTEVNKLFYYYKYDNDVYCVSLNKKMMDEYKNLLREKKLKTLLNE